MGKCPLSCFVTISDFQAQDRWPWILHRCFIWRLHFLNHLKIIKVFKHDRPKSTLVWEKKRQGKEICFTHKNHGWKSGASILSLATCCIVLSTNPQREANHLRYKIKCTPDVKCIHQMTLSPARDIYETFPPFDHAAVYNQIHFLH